MANTGNKGKFSERIKNILKAKRRKKEIVSADTQIRDSKEIYYNFLKVMAIVPSLVYGSLKSDDGKQNQVTNNSKVNETLSDKKVIRKRNRILIEKINVDEIKRKHRISMNIPIVNLKQQSVNKSNKVDNTAVNSNRPNIKSADSKLLDSNLKKGVSSVSKQQSVGNNSKVREDLFEDKTSIFSPPKETVASKPANDINLRTKELEKNIINLIKKDLIRIVNEMEILQSELYILSEVSGEDKVLKDCQKKLDEVKSILCKVDKLKEKYDFLKDNYDFEYLLEIGDDNLADKIIELKNTVERSEVKALVEDYKLLDVYKYLYLKIDEFKDKTITYEEQKKEEVEKLEKRDIDFEKLKRDVYNVDYANRNYDRFVSSQNDILKEIDANVSKISSYEQIDYHLKGFGELFRNSFKYFGLLMVSPLKGIIPSIATETIITGNIIKNLYHNLKWEETRKTVYEAVDYSSIISGAIDDLDNTGRIVDATLEDIVHLKMEYNDKFKKYQGDFLEYRDIMHKINDMENKIFGNKIKIEMMKKRVLEQKKENVKKLVLVKELNNKENQL